MKNRTATVIFRSFVPLRVEIDPNDPNMQITKVEVYGPPINKSVRLPRLSAALQESIGIGMYWSFTAPIPLPGLDIQGSIPISALYSLMTEKDVAETYSIVWREYEKALVAKIDKIAAKM